MELKQRSRRSQTVLMVLLGCGLVLITSAAALLTVVAARSGNSEGGGTSSSLSPYASQLHTLLNYLQSHPDPALATLMDELLKAPVLSVEAARQLYAGALSKLKWCV